MIDETLANTNLEVNLVGPLGGQAVLRAGEDENIRLFGVEVAR
jgi:hypothetical protein